MVENKWPKDDSWLMALEKDLEDLERTDPEVAAAALGFRRMSERMMITPVDSRKGDTERHPDESDIKHVALQCDRCRVNEINGDYRARTQAWAYVALRRDAATRGWAILANQDLCPGCAGHPDCVFPEKCCQECHRHRTLHVDCILR